MMGSVTKLPHLGKLIAHAMLPNKHEMANSRLRNIDKRLIRKPPVGEDYQRVVTSYVDKGCTRKVQPTENEPKRTW